eukprot:COSAG02_NODE_58879_length_276_cov_0.576271_1_plen_52_part_01
MDAKARAKVAAKEFRQFAMFSARWPTRRFSTNVSVLCGWHSMRRQSQHFQVL